jgi:hypothetical protein
MERQVSKKILAELDRKGIPHTDVQSQKVAVLFVTCLKHVREGTAIRDGKKNRTVNPQGNVTY